MNIIQFLYNYGHLKYPFGVEQDIPSDINKLKMSDKEVREAMRSHQSMDVNYEYFVQAYHNRSLVADGDAGPATSAVMALPRCGHPDYAEAAIGGGNWPGCHNIGNFHAASIKIMNKPPNFLDFPEVQQRVQEAYAELGLMLYFDGREPHNIELSFVNSSSGWIGLAEVVNGMSCSDNPIFCRFLSSYTGGDSTVQWTTLVKHELGHNCGLNHSRGGVMNPSIINGLPISWKEDVSYPSLEARFGGKPILTSRKMVLAWKYPDGSFEEIADIPQKTGFWPTGDQT